jgi:hypothetical protein
MKTKCQIVQELLDAKKITAEDAVVLLMSDKEKEIVYVPRPYPAAPYSPFWEPNKPYWVVDVHNPWAPYSSASQTFTAIAN